MKVLVTGGSGAIGRYVIKELVAHDITPTILDVRPPAKAVPGVDFSSCDLMSLESTLAAIKGYDAVVHLAAIPHPFNDPWDRVMSVNMTTTYNVVEAVRQNGIPRLVYGCSESSTGFGIHYVDLVPEYLPIDEEHPCWPHETYSLTKRFGEEMSRLYATAYGFEAISLRYCWVWLDRNADDVHAIIELGKKGQRNTKDWFGCYIAPHDVAQGIRRSLQYQFPQEKKVNFEAFFLTAETTFFPMPTLDALKETFKPLPEVRVPHYYADNPYAPPFDIRKAKRLLGFEPTMDWRDYDTWEKP